MPRLGPARRALRTTPLARLHPAVRVAGLVLAAVTAFVLPAAAAAAAALLVMVLLAGSGLGWDRQLAGLRAWWPLAVLVLAVHVLTTTDAAPLGRPSWAGLAAGVLALTRVGTAVGCLALLTRTTGLNETAGALRWWLAPLRRLGVRDADLPLMLTVAVGTAPSVLDEARRLEAALALRRHAGDTAGPGPWRRIADRARVVVPLCESLVRRADGLALALRRRRPVAIELGRPGRLQLAALAAWALALAAAAVGAGRSTPW
jgi:energy-coupling factor transporter transmembrane protein EcfT